jgi:hypothetical protein
MVEACERRILEFPLDMDAREVAKALKREGWYAWASSYESIIFRITFSKNLKSLEKTCPCLQPLPQLECSIVWRCYRRD